MKKLFKTLSFAMLVTSTAVFAQYNNMPSSATDYGNPPTQMNNNTEDQATDYGNPPAPGSMNNNIPDDASDYGNQPVADQDVYEQQTQSQGFNNPGETNISESDQRVDEITPGESRETLEDQSNQEFSE